ncbi:hypothetical protein ACFFRR_006131 [Megaselia abdita]
MNRGRVSRKYRNYRRGASNVVDMCLRYFHFGHHRITCRKEPIVTCGKCFRAYYFSTECPCNHNDTDGMTFRLVGGEPFPRPCIDVMIGNNNYEALINQSKSRTTINSEVFNYINFLKEQSNLPAVSSNEIIHFNIKRRQKEVMVEIETDKHQTNPIIIGMEFLTKTGFELRIDKVSVNQCSPVLESPTTINFLYNLEQGKCCGLGWKQKNYQCTINTKKETKHYFKKSLALLLIMNIITILRFQNMFLKTQFHNKSIAMRMSWTYIPTQMIWIIFNLLLFFFYFGLIYCLQTKRTNEFILENSHKNWRIEI